MRECAEKIVVTSSSSSTSFSRGSLKQLHIKSITCVLRGCCQFDHRLCQFVDQAERLIHSQGQLTEKNYCFRIIESRA